jgi:NADP-dependent 3-hydroxy acid dehydrogenase YdfG
MNKPLIVITGATSGIGFECAIRFHKQGYPLLLLGRNIEKLKVMQLANVLVEAVDVADLDSFKQAVTKATSIYGPVDAMFNVAGQMLLGDIATQDANEWQRMLDVNIKGVLNGMQVVLSEMKKRQHGTIINVSSIAGIKPFPNHAAYTATKFAVCGMTENVREEVAPFNIRVMTVSPGAVETSLLSHTTSDEIKVGYAQWKQEMGGVLAPEVVADIMLYAYEQPQSVCMREIVVSATKQQA